MKNPFAPRLPETLTASVIAGALSKPFVFEITDAGLYQLNGALHNPYAQVGTVTLNVDWVARGGHRQTWSLVGVETGAPRFDGGSRIIDPLFGSLVHVIASVAGGPMGNPLGVLARVSLSQLSRG